jgi:anti-sigma factor RsiW
MLTCQEVADYLSAYIAGELSPAEQAAMDRHIAVCPACVNFLASFQTTVQATQSKTLFPISEPIPEGLIQAVLAARKERPQP